MKTNCAGRNIVIEFEALRLEAYPDPASKLAIERRKPESDRATDWQALPGDPWTIGFGATGNGIGPGVKWTEEEAWVRLEQDIERVEKEVEHLAQTVLNENQFSALVAFTYNVGTVNLCKSTLLEKINDGDIDGAAAEFPKWCHAGGVVMRGLVIRREAEQKLFLTQVAAVA